jgi:hypothetical protein
MKLHPQDLQKIAHLTLEHYNERAEEFWEGTRDHDVSQNIEALLQHIEGKPPFTILDFGCGPGRDLKVFAEKGHIAIGLEGAEHFAAMARAHSGCEVWQQDFLKLELPEKYFESDLPSWCYPGVGLPKVLALLIAFRPFRIQARRYGAGLRLSPVLGRRPVAPVYGPYKFGFSGQRLPPAREGRQRLSGHQPEASGSAAEGEVPRA